MRMFPVSRELNRKFSRQARQTALLVDMVGARTFAHELHRATGGGARGRLLRIALGAAVGGRLGAMLITGDVRSVMEGVASRDVKPWNSGKVKP